MNRKILATVALVATLVTTGAQRASADIGDAIAGGIIGGIIVGAINDRNGTRRTAPHREPSAPSAARQMARSIQTALNHFRFDVGPVDGVLGRQSRAGIRQYQAYLSFPATGELSEFERQVLLTAYERAALGGPQVTQVTATHPNGIRGLLDTVRDEMLGVSRQPVVEAAAPAAPPAPVAAAPAVPNFFAGQSSATEVSLASRCNRVALVTSANGGFTNLDTMTDPVFALNEQFCLARGYAIAEGETLVAQVPGATAQGVAQQCAGLEPLLQPYVAALSLQPRNAVLQEVAQFVLNSGMSPTDLAGTARICLSSGYLSDNMTVAIGSAMVLVALGESAYGELPGHHLMQGIGAAQRPDLAQDWFTNALATQSAGPTEVAFRPGPDGRNELILAAARAANGPAVSPIAPAAPAPGTVNSK